MSDESFLVYGANGYTGRLVAERAKQRGLRPIVAGRSASAIETVARELDLPHRVFGLDDPAAVDAGLQGVRLVLHCAGPYSATSRPMVDACLRVGAHYLDITGEYAVLEAVLARRDEAVRAKIVLLPAVGFDVVPTDCMAAKLAEALPDAVRLELAFSGGLAPSPGTAKTAVEGLGVGALVREGGELVELSGPRTRDLPFRGGLRPGMSIPWGDLVTAFFSTGIPNITVYTEAPRAVARVAGLLRFVAPVLKAPPVVRFLKAQIGSRVHGPSEELRRKARMEVWGRVVNASGKAVEGHLTLPEGYELTVLSALACAERVLGGRVPPGATTPSLAFGADFVTTLPGVSAFVLS
jgi:short subunit dehydrogenase-like uncharacterized protein